ncbi:2-dehydropantoate 2-reductase [Photobacterium sp. MCCC 1A19761]|uniref:2-dehydropantoate 2-reductase n=1 Tax=Photobacterium sp. MCCC 1A19761 TaxID=3115000 RepID=UPI00307F0B8E
MNLTIVGAGAIGRLWGCHLSQYHAVQFWTRDSASELSLTFNPLAQTPPQHYTFAANQPAQLQQADAVLLTVKAFQVEQALTSILPYLPSRTPVIVMHNGMGTHKNVSALLPDNPLLYATTAQAAYRPTSGQLNHTGLGQTWIGAINASGKAQAVLAGLLNQALPPCQWHEHILIPLWQKLAINCAINPLTAMMQCRNGELAQARYHQQLDAICTEVAAVMNAEGIACDRTTLRHQVDQVINNTAGNYSSMNQDISQHRPTEIDYITGYLIDRAQEHGIAVPENTRLWQQIKQLEQQHHDA